MDELVRLTDYTYDRDAVIAMEATILKRMKFSISFPTAAVFLKRFLRVSELSEGTRATKKVNTVRGTASHQKGKYCQRDREPPKR